MWVNAVQTLHNQCGLISWYPQARSSFLHKNYYVPGTSKGERNQRRSWQRSEMPVQQPLTVAALGCSGPVAAHIVNSFLQQSNVKLRVLARTPEKIQALYPKAEIVAGSMANPDDVAAVVKDVDMAFLITPMGKNNDTSLEIEVARKTIEGCKQGHVKHLVYASVFDVRSATTGDDTKPTGVAILDAKLDVEKLIHDSGVPHSILRCGTYMEDAFDPRLSLLKKGLFLFPIDTQREFNYTSQKDIPRFIVEHLSKTAAPLNGPIDFFYPTTYSIAQVEEALSTAAGFTIRTVPKTPFLYMFKTLLPVFRWQSHRFSSVIPLVEYFDQHGYTGDSQRMQTEFSDFHLTSLAEHLSVLFSET